MVILKDDPIYLLLRCEARVVELMEHALGTDLESAAEYEARALTMIKLATVFRESVRDWNPPSAPPPPDRYAEARAFVMGSRNASCSFVQRALRMGFNETAGYIERMEEAGVVGAAREDGRRPVLQSTLQSDPPRSD